MTPSNIQPTAGEIRQTIVDGAYEVWTRRAGHGPITLLLLHGDPGCIYEYSEDFVSPDKYTFCCDQLDSLSSEEPDNHSLWTVKGLREEGEQGHSALGLEAFHPFDNSWGGMLAIEYAVK